MLWWLYVALAMVQLKGNLMHGLSQQTQHPRVILVEHVGTDWDFACVEQSTPVTFASVLNIYLYPHCHAVHYLAY